jgi:hypothetical protein
VRFETAVTDRWGGVGERRGGKAVAARMLWVGLDVVRQEFAKVRRGRDACGMFRQSGNGRDVIGLDGCVLARQSRQGAGGFV